MVLLAAVAVAGGICGTASADATFTATPYLSAYGAWQTPSWHGPPNSWNGGEFNVKVQTGTTFYQDAKAYGGSYDFSTFCIQQNQVFSPGSTYTVHADIQSDGGQDIPLTSGLAWLFHQWNSGALDGYVYNRADAAGRLSSAVDLQEVIWQLMYDECVRLGKSWSYGGRSEIPNYDSSRVNQLNWYTWAKAPPAAWQGKVYGVRVMKMYDAAGAPAQDFLYDQTSGPNPSPKVPEPASLALLAVGGLPVLPFLRRRRPVA